MAHRNPFLNRKKKKKKEEPKKTTKKATHSSRGEERREGAQRARETTPVKVVSGGVQYGAQRRARDVTQATGWASKQAYERSGIGNRGKSGAIHKTRDTERANEKQKTRSGAITSQHQKEQQQRKKVRDSNYKQVVTDVTGKKKEQSYIKGFTNTQKKLENKMEKSLDYATSNFDDKKKHKILGKEYTSKDIAKGGIKLADEMVDYLIPYGATAKTSLKIAEGALKASKGAKAGKALTEATEKGLKGLSKDGKKKVIKEYTKRIAKGEKPQEVLDSIQKQVMKSDLKQNVKRELIANAMQDATIGTTIDAIKGKQQGLKGKDFRNYMLENAAMNAAIGLPVSRLAGRTGKAGKIALANDTASVINESFAKVGGATKAESKELLSLTQKAKAFERSGKSISAGEKARIEELTNKIVNSTSGIAQVKHDGKLIVNDKGVAKDIFSGAELDNYINLKTRLDTGAQLTPKEMGRYAELSKRMGDAYKTVEANSVAAINLAKKGKPVSLDMMDSAVNFRQKMGGTKAQIKEAKDARTQSAMKLFDVDRKTAEVITTTGERTNGKLSIRPLTELEAQTKHGFPTTHEFEGLRLKKNDGSGEQVIYFNPKSVTKVRTIAHEIGHVASTNDSTFVNTIKKFAGEDWQKEAENVNKVYDSLEKDMLEQNGFSSKIKYDEETACNLLGRYTEKGDVDLFAYIASDNRSLFEKIRDHLRKIFSSDASLKQDATLKKIYDQIEDAYENMKKPRLNGSTEQPAWSTGGLRAARERAQEGDPTFLNDFNEALRRLKSGVSEEDVWKDLHWGLDADGQWKYDIDDSHMRFNYGKTIKNENNNGSSIVYRNKNTGKVEINEAKYDEYDNKVKAIEDQLRRNWDTSTRKKLTGKKREALEKERDKLNSKINMYIWATRGLPMQNVIRHDALFKMYPELKDVKCVLRFDGEFSDIKTQSLYTADGSIARFLPAHEPPTIILNGNLLNSSTNIYKAFEKSGENIDRKVNESLIHEMVHYVQDYENAGSKKAIGDDFARGSSPDSYADTGGDDWADLRAGDFIYPKLGKENERLHKQLRNERNELEDAITDYGWSIGEPDLFDDFKAAYDNAKIMNYDEMEWYFDLGSSDGRNVTPKEWQDAKRNFTAMLWRSAIEENNFKSPTKEFELAAKKFINADYELGRVSEIDPDTLYSQELGETLARREEKRQYREGLYDRIEGVEARRTDRTGYSEDYKYPQLDNEGRIVKPEPINRPVRDFSTGGRKKPAENSYTEETKVVKKAEPKRAKETEDDFDKYDVAGNPKETPEQPKPEASKEEVLRPANHKDFLERARRTYSKEDMNQTAINMQNKVIDEYGGYEEWHKMLEDEVGNGSYGKLKSASRDEANTIAQDEFKKYGYEEMRKQFLQTDAITQDPNVLAARGAVLDSEIERMLKAGEGDVSQLHADRSEIMEKLSGISSWSSHYMNALKRFATSTPKGRVRTVENEIKRLEKLYQDRLKGEHLKVDEAKLIRLGELKKQYEIDELLDEINKDLWEQIPATLFERINEYRHCFMLFNPKTHGRNLVGNSIFRFCRKLSDEMENGMLNSKWATNKLADIQKMKPEEVVVDRVHVSKKDEIKPNNMYLYNEFRSVYDKSGSRNKFIELGRPDGVDTVRWKAMQKLINANYGLLEKEDLKGALIPAFNKSYVSWCKARCVKDVGADKYSPEALQKFMHNMSEADKKKARRYALAEGEYATFRDACAFSDWLTGKKQTFAGKKGKTSWGTLGYRVLDTALEGAIPFVKTPVNIFRRSVDFSPASFVPAVLNIAKAENADMFKQGIHQLCTGLTGTGIMGMGVYFASQGIVMIKAGEESGDAYYDRDMGYQDYSVKLNLGGREVSMTLDWAQPMQASFFMGAAFHNALANMYDEETGKWHWDDQSIINAFFAITSPMTDTSFMSSPKDTVQRFLENATRSDTGETNFPSAMVQLLAGDIPKNYVSGLAPQLLAQLAGTMDDYQRDTRGVSENSFIKGWESAGRQLINKVPVLREYVLNPKLNRKGNEVENDENMAVRIAKSFFMPMNVKEITKDKYDEELIKIRNGIEDKSSKDYRYFFYNLTGNPPYGLANGKRMTYDEAYKYGKTSRIQQNQMIKSMVDADSYGVMTQKMKQKEVGEAYWIAKAKADMDTYSASYAIKALASGEYNEKEVESIKEYRRLLKGTLKKEEIDKKYMDYYIEKEKLVLRAHASGDDVYKLKALVTLEQGKKTLRDALDIKASHVKSMQKYWGLVKADGGNLKQSKATAFKELTDGCCSIMSHVDEAGISNPSKGVKSVSAGIEADEKRKISERVYRAYGHNWNSAQSGAGLMMKYNKDGKYSVEKIQEMKAKIRLQYDANNSGGVNKDEVVQFIKDQKCKTADEAACLFEVLYSQGNYKNPFKSQIDDHLEWGENHDDEWDTGKGSGGGWGRGWGRGGHGHGGGGGGGSKPARHPVANVDTASGIFNGKVTNPAPLSNFNKKSNLDEAYRKKARKLREANLLKLS